MAIVQLLIHAALFVRLVTSLQVSELPASIGELTPTARSDACLQSFGDVAILFGGRNDTHDLDDTWLLFAANNSWVRYRYRYRPAARFAAICSTKDTGRHRLFTIIGGRNKTDVLDHSLVWTFDLETLRWNEISELSNEPSLRRAWALGGAVMNNDGNNTVLLSHGLSPTGYTCSAVLVDMKLRRITPLVPESSMFSMGIPHQFIGAAHAMYDDGLLTVGGCNIRGRCPSDLSWFLNVTTGKWKPAPSAIIPQFGACLARVPETQILILLGGQMRSAQMLTFSNTSDISFFRFANQTWFQDPNVRDMQSESRRIGANLFVLGVGYAQRFVIFGGREADGSHQLVPQTNVLKFKGRAIISATASDKIRSYNALDVHGILMLIAFGFGFPFGLYVARIFRFFTQSHHWFQFHYTVQSISFILTIFGSISIFASTPSSKADHPHAIIGIILLTILTIQIIFTLPVLKPKPDDGRRRTIWEAVHKWNGRAIVALGLINASLGMLLYIVPRWAWIAWIVYAALLIAGAFTTEFYHLFRKLKPITSYEPYEAADLEKSSQSTPHAKEEQLPNVQYGLNWFPA